MEHLEHCNLIGCSALRPEFKHLALPIVQGQPNVAELRVLTHWHIECNRLPLHHYIGVLNALFQSGRSHDFQ